jgi:short-chain fatty acids transporter
MSFADKFTKAFKTLLPAPFTIAVLLTILTYFIAVFVTKAPDDATITASQETVSYGDSIVLTASKGKTYEWTYTTQFGNDTIATKQSITVFPKKSQEYQVTVTDTLTQYSSVALIPIDIDKGAGTGSVGKSSNDTTPKFIQALLFWEGGLWNNNGLIFAMQMMLMLILGHVLALSAPVDRVIVKAVKYCNNTANAAALVTLLTVVVSLFNWGLGLIFGAIFARKVAEHAANKGISLNYPLIGAAGYSGLMVWHGGISGSSLTKIADPGHIQGLMKGTAMKAEEIKQLPESIGFEATVFSNMNITVSIALIILLPLFMYFIGKRIKDAPFKLRSAVIDSEGVTTQITGAEKLDYSRIFALFFALIILGVATYKALILPDQVDLKFITPNFINLTLFGLGILLHGNFIRFLKAIDSAISGAAGIMIQFPLYFGIMGIMKSTGLVSQFADFFVSISNSVTYPIYTFFSAGIVNIFVPSGGGQWAVQGPIIIESAKDLGVPLNKSIMALAYGDQITNMLQPFWALPLLGITGLKAKEIIPYTLLLMLIGSVIFITGLLIF